MGKINRETAENDVTAWLDKKKVFEETREKYKEHIDILVEAIMNGVLVLDTTTFEFTHNLLFALGENEDKKELKYRARITDKQITPHMRGVKNDDADGRLQALIAALTSESKGVIANLDSGDKRIATAVGIFFI